MKYPKWTPKILIVHYFKYFERDPNLAERNKGIKEKRDLLLRLLTDSRMEQVWKEITKQAKKNLKGDITDYVFVRVFISTHNATLAYRFSKKETRRKKANRQLGIAQAARKLSKALEGSELDRSPLCLYNLDDFDSLKWALPKGTSVADLFKQLESLDMVGFSQRLNMLADKADELASEAMVEPTLISKPNIENSRRLVFIRYMALHFKWEFGSPLYRTLASLTSVALEESIDHVTAREALRGWKFPDTNNVIFPQWLIDS